MLFILSKPIQRLKWATGLIPMKDPVRISRKIIERFQPQAIYGNATRRQTFMVVELETPAKMAELMYVLAWWLKTEPVFTPDHGTRDLR